MTRWLAVVACLAACKDDPVGVTASDRSGSDHGRGEVIAAVARLAAAGHTPAAFAGFRDRLLVLRPTMDDTVADEAERLAVTQAVEVVRQVPDAARGAGALVLTVWPLALAPEISAPVPGEPVVDRWTPWMPTAGEDVDAYLERLCGGLLALDCKAVVPEGRAAVVTGRAIGRMTERARRAVALCLTCGHATWQAWVAAWEALDGEATAAAATARSRYAPTRWPIAGEGSRPPVDGPVLQATDEGALELGGRPLIAGDEDEVIDRLRSARGAATILRLHLPPKMAVARVHRLQQLAIDAGYPQIALIARQPMFPFAPRDYLLGAKDKPPVKDVDPLQVMLRVLDTRARRAAKAAQIPR